ncbi:hypothetical protein PLS229_11360 [Xylella taiwanensis]|nr:hypothetical protein PLS229_11360 [Xylella taiwanensis]
MIDFDMCHGNGTQTNFGREWRVQSCSRHRSDLISVLWRCSRTSTTCCCHLAAMDSTFATSEADDGYK